MWQLVKRDYSIIFIFIIFALLFKFAMFGFAAISFLSSDNMYFFSFVLMMLYALIFHFDNSSKIMRIIVSLPIKKRHIIISRYISLYTIGLIFLSFAFVVDYSLDQQAVHLINVYLAVCTFTIYIAISTPVYYFFKRLWVSIAVHYFLIIFSSLAFAFLFVDPFDWFTPFLNVAFTILDFQPVVVSLLCLILLMYGSYRVSYFLFSRKDVL